MLWLKLLQTLQSVCWWSISCLKSWTMLEDPLPRYLTWLSIWRQFLYQGSGLCAPWGCSDHPEKPHWEGLRCLLHSNHSSDILIVSKTTQNQCRHCVAANWTRVKASWTRSDWGPLWKPVCKNFKCITAYAYLIFFAGTPKISKCK